MTILHMFVPGKPIAQGSKAFKGLARNGRGILVESSKDLGPWRERVALVAHNAMLESRLTPFLGALALELKFVLPRPLSTPKRRPTPPAIKKPDLDKVQRAIFDALTSVCYRDDAQIINVHAKKRLAEINETPGVHIRLTEVLA